MQTITQSEPTILMSIWITDRARRHLKAEAAKAGQTMGDFVTGLLQKHGGFVPLPAVSGSSRVDAAGGRQSAGTTSKGK